VSPFILSQRNSFRRNITYPENYPEITQIFVKVIVDGERIFLTIKMSYYDTN